MGIFCSSKPRKSKFPNEVNQNKEAAVKVEKSTTNNTVAAPVPPIIYSPKQKNQPSIINDNSIPLQTASQSPSHYVNGNASDNYYIDAASVKNDQSVHERISVTHKRQDRHPEVSQFNGTQGQDEEEAIPIYRVRDQSLSHLDYKKKNNYSMETSQLLDDMRRRSLRFTIDKHGHVCITDKQKYKLRHDAKQYSTKRIPKIEIQVCCCCQNQNNKAKTAINRSICSCHPAPIYSQNNQCCCNKPKHYCYDGKLNAYNSKTLHYPSISPAPQPSLPYIMESPLCLPPYPSYPSLPQSNSFQTLFTPDLSNNCCNCIPALSSHYMSPLLECGLCGYNGDYS